MGNFPQPVSYALQNNTIHSNVIIFASKQRLPYANNAQSPIFKLSRELRDEIWTHLVTAPKAIPLAVQYEYDENWKLQVSQLGLAKKANAISSADLEGLSILRVCRQINTEASEIMLSKNIWRNYNGDSVGVFARQLCACKTAQIRYVLLNCFAQLEPRPWNDVVEAISTFSNLRLVATEITTNMYANRGGVDAEYIARQMKKRWTGFADAMKGSTHLEKVYVNSELDRLPLKDGNKGPLTSLLWSETIVLTSARGLKDGFSQELFNGKARELDIRQEIEYWQNWDLIDKNVYDLEVEEAESQWEGNTCQDGRYVNSEGETDNDSDDEEYGC